MNTSKIFSGISARAWEHPSDRAALDALRNVPGIGDLLKFFGGWTHDRIVRLGFLGSCLRTGPTQLGRVHEIVEKACDILSVHPRPEAYVVNQPEWNALALGFDRPFLVIHSSLVSHLGDEELLAVVGHELGHIKGGHVVYRTMLWILLQVGFLSGVLPDWISLPLILALKEWYRKSELSCDRAGLLVCQDPEVSQNLLVKFASGGLPGVNAAGLLAQAEEYESSPDVLDSVYKFFQNLNLTHPFLAIRLREITRWASSKEYQDILNGSYARESEIPDPLKSGQSAYESWKEELKNTSDAAGKTLHGVVEGVEGMLAQLDSFFKGIFRDK